MHTDRKMQEQMQVHHVHFSQSVSFIAYVLHVILDTFAAHSLIAASSIAQKQNIQTSNVNTISIRDYTMGDLLSN